ncbi:MAG: nickel pincer cofactor biosynthesis protein LarC [Deltaproteobacteria bacterium]|nr:nickel pincer cofactor biosynthesis protein LarC [Deltaproteobacteria bacterium]
MTTAYLDCFSGISGDMFLGALLDLGLPFEELNKAIGSLPFHGYSMDRKKEMKNGLSSTRFLVSVDEHHHVHRNLTDIEGIITAGKLSDDVKERSLRIFRAIAGVEGAIHNHPPEKVHFHEVGAVDSIIDIVGAAFGVDYMGISSFYASHIPLGSGFIKSGHGTIPLPAPATIALLKGIPVYNSGLEYELVTPTGAALVKEFVSSFEGMPPMVIGDIGYGAGTRDLPDRPNLLRIITGQYTRDAGTETVAVLEANIDDTNPEWLGFIMERLFEEGALDVIFTPVFMKKNRPGIQVEVIGHPETKDHLIEILFQESTTIGIRYRYSQRKILKREELTVESPWGALTAKRIILPDGKNFIQPEYESCKKVAQEHGIPLKDVYTQVLSINSRK